MNKIFGVAIVLVVLGAIYAVFGLMRAEPVYQSDGPRVEKAKVQQTTATAHEETALYSITVQYPQFGIPAIDAGIKSKVDAAINDIKSASGASTDPNVQQNSLDGRFESVYLGPDVISGKLIFSEYTGGAHPLDVIEGFNYDRATGNELSLDDALRMSGLTLAQVSAQASKKLKASLGDVFAADGARAIADNFSTFVMSAHEVTFIFQPYQVAPYAAGPQEVSFPRK